MCLAVVTGLNNFSRVLGGALGVAIASAVLNSFLQKNLPGVLPEQYVLEVFNSPEYIRNGLPEEYIHLATEVYVESLRYVWYILIAMSSVGTCPEHPRECARLFVLWIINGVWIMFSF